MKWTLTQKKGQFIVRFAGEQPLTFISREAALAYINDKVLTALGV